MEKYNDNNKCPKCGCLTTFDKYFEDKDQIRRKCTRCEYLWWEIPLDTFAKKLNNALKCNILKPDVHFDYIE